MLLEDLAAGTCRRISVWKRGEEKLEISINALLLKINTGNIGNAANYLEIGGLCIICKVKYMAPVQG